MDFGAHREVKEDVGRIGQFDKKPYIFNRVSIELVIRPGAADGLLIRG